MRRRRVELQLARLLKIGQDWRRRHDGSVWTVHQVHRKDCLVELRRDGLREHVAFDVLRAEWRLIVPATVERERAA